MQAIEREAAGRERLLCSGLSRSKDGSAVVSPSASPSLPWSRIAVFVLWLYVCYGEQSKSNLLWDDKMREELTLMTR